MVKCYLNNKTIEGIIISPLRGGFSVCSQGFIAFLPKRHTVKGRSPNYKH